MYFNATKATAVLAFTAAIASAAATPHSGVRRGDDKDYGNSAKEYYGEEQKKDYKDGKHEASYVEQLKKHEEEVEKQFKLTKEAAEKNKQGAYTEHKDKKYKRSDKDGKNGKDDDKKSTVYQKPSSTKSGEYAKFTDYWKSKYDDKDDGKKDKKDTKDDNEDKEVKQDDKKAGYDDKDYYKNLQAQKQNTKEYEEAVKKYGIKDDKKDGKKDFKYHKDDGKKDDKYDKGVKKDDHKDAKKDDKDNLDQEKYDEKHVKADKAYNKEYFI